jgi:tRNA-Thr(GGU) m(6)t(6)A37 methyltransferase TsaA
MKIDIQLIGQFYTDAEKIPRHWTVSNEDGVICLEKQFTEAAKDIKAGQQIVVIFLFDRSRGFTLDDIVQSPKHKNHTMGVFSICSPVRPNPIGMSVLEVLAINGSEIKVRGIDMLNKTPILDIKPYVENKHDCPSFPKKK